MRIAVCLAFAVLTTASVLAAEKPVTNDDVVRMVGARIDTAVVVKLVETSPTVSFDISPSALIALKSSGVPGPILEAMIARANASVKGDVGELSKPALPPPPTGVDANHIRVEPKNAIYRLDVYWNYGRAQHWPAELLLFDWGISWIWTDRDGQHGISAPWALVKSLCHEDPAHLLNVWRGLDAVRLIVAKNGKSSEHLFYENTNNKYVGVHPTSIFVEKAEELGHSRCADDD